MPINEAKTRSEIAAFLGQMSRMSRQMHERAIASREIITQSREFMAMADELALSRALIGRDRRE